MKRVYAVLLVFVFLVVGCCTPQGYLSAKTVKSNYEAVAKPFLRYVDGDEDMPEWVKDVHRNGVDRFRLLIEKAEAEAGDE